MCEVYNDLGVQIYHNVNNGAPYVHAIVVKARSVGSYNTLIGILCNHTVFFM